MGYCETINRLERSRKGVTMIKLIGKYRNGNYDVKIYDDGTKIRETEDDEFIPSFSENCDVLLTSKCQQLCKFCYEGCTPEGKHSEIDLDSPFINSLHPYTELAINGNDMDHPQLVRFLEKLKEKEVIANMTVNQFQFEKNLGLIKNLQERGLLHGIGISLLKADEKLIQSIKQVRNAVLHTICGILSKDDIEFLKDNGIKILVLGYKDLERGHDFKESNGDLIKANTEYLDSVLEKMPEWFNVVSFDNLALTQLGVRRIMTDNEWDEFYMGDDGQYTFYVDLVRKEFARNSLSKNRHPMGDMTIDEMFDIVRNEK